MRSHSRPDALSPPRNARGGVDPGSSRIPTALTDHNMIQCNTWYAMHWLGTIYEKLQRCNCWWPVKWQGDVVLHPAIAPLWSTLHCDLILLYFNIGSRTTVVLRWPTTVVAVLLSILPTQNCDQSFTVVNLLCNVVHFVIIPDINFYGFRIFSVSWEKFKTRCAASMRSDGLHPMW